jgi:hypothetical protein
MLTKRHSVWRQLSAAPSKVFRISVCASVDAASALHKRLQPHPGLFASGNVPQRTGPLADGLVVSKSPTRAANDSREGVCMLLEWKMSEFERVPQQPIRPPSYLVKGNDCKYCLQITRTLRHATDWLENRPTHHAHFQARPPVSAFAPLSRNVSIDAILGRGSGSSLATPGTTRPPEVAGTRRYLGWRYTTVRLTPLRRSRLRAELGGAINAVRASERSQQPPRSAAAY